MFLLVLGPSTITTMAGNDGAGVATYSVAGAKFGYAILFSLLPLLFLYSISQEMGSRTAIVSGKGLADLIREKFGIKVSLITFLFLLIANFGSTLANVSALKVASHMFNIPTIPFILMTIVFAFLLVTRFDYKRSQYIFLTGMILYLSYVFSAYKGNPDWTEAFKGMFIPSRHLLSKEYLLTAIAVIGTTITPWGQFFVQSYMKDKNITVEKIGFGKLEAYFGSFIALFFTFFIVVATAATLHVNSIPLESGEQAALAIRPFAGVFSSILFGVGLVNAAFIGMVIISLSTAYVFSELFGFEGTLDAPYQKSKLFYGLFLFNLIVPAIIVMFSNISLFKVVLFTQSLNAILLPLIFFFLLKITNDKEIMGEYTNTKIYNIIAIFASIFIVCAALFAIISSLFS